MLKEYPSEMTFEVPTCKRHEPGSGLIMCTKELVQGIKQVSETLLVGGVYLASLVS